MFNNENEQTTATQYHRFKILLSSSLKMYMCTFEYVYKLNNDKNKCKGTILHP